MKVALGQARNREPAQKDGSGPLNNRERLARYVEELKPQVLAAFEGQNLAAVPRPELAVRIGAIVTEATEADSESLNLLDRRNLVATLISWLLHSSPLAPPPPEEPAPAEAAAEAPARPSNGWSLTIGGS